MNKTLIDMKRKLWMVPDNREDIKTEKFNWITDFDDINGVGNLALRKTDKINFAIFNEGNIFNNLFYKALSL